MKANIFTKIVTSKPIKYAIANAPKILTGISIASSIAAVGFSIKGTILAVEIEKQRKAKIESGDIPQPEHPKWETVKSVWKCYIPAFTFLSVSIGTSLYGTSVSAARTAMATAACKASELAFEDYKAKVEEQFGSGSDKKIEQAIAKDQADIYASQSPSTILVSPYDRYPCKEKYSGQIIESDLNEIKDGFNKINYDLSSGRSDYISFMEYCDVFGIDNSNSEVGWNITKTGLLSLKYDLGQDEYGRPIIIFYPSIPPYEDYYNYG